MAGMDLGQMQGQLDPYYAAGVRHMKEQKMKEHGEKAMHAITEMQESMIDKEMKELESYTEDDFEKLREIRKRKMMQAQKEQQKNVLNGHGRYMELSDQKEFFDACKASKQLVIHFYRPSTIRCQIVDRHLEALSAKHLETRFLKINAEKCPFLIEKLRIIMLPTMLCVKDGKTEHAIIGFDEMGGTDEFPTEVLALVLSSYDVLKYSKEEFMDDAGIGQDEIEEIEADDKGINKMKINRGPAIREGVNDAAAADEDYDSEDDAQYYEGLDEIGLGTSNNIEE